MGQTHKSILLLIKTHHCNFWIQLAEVLRLYSESRLQVINHAPGYQFLLIKVQNLYQLSKYDNDVCSKFESLQLYGRFGDGSKVYLLNCIALCQLISSFFFFFLLPQHKFLPSSSSSSAHAPATYKLL